MTLVGRVGWWVLVVVVALVGCGQGGGRGRGEPLDVVRLDPEAPVVRVDVPLPARYGALVVPAGGEILVLGGGDPEFEDPDPNDELTEFRHLADGARYEMRTGRWWPIAPIPVGPLDDPAGVWTGEELVVVGSPCGPGSGWVEEEDATVCRPGGLWLGAYRPSTDTWRELARPVRLDHDGYRDWKRAKGWVWQVGRVGWTGREAVFAVGRWWETGRLLLVDTAAGTSRWAYKPGAGGGDTSSPMSCMAGGEVLVVVGILHTESTLRVFRLDRDGESWGEIDTNPRPVTTPFNPDWIACDAARSGPVYAPIREPSNPPLWEWVWWWDRASRRWERLPPVPAIPGVRIPHVLEAFEVEGHKVLRTRGMCWPGACPPTHPDPAEQDRPSEESPPQLGTVLAWFALGPGDREWRRVPVPDAVSAGFGFVGIVDGWMVSEVLSRGEPRPGESRPGELLPVPRVVFVNVARLLGLDTPAPAPTSAPTG